jgi:hypothetical protein
MKRITVFALGILGSVVHGPNAVASATAGKTKQLAVVEATNSPGSTGAVAPTAVEEIPPPPEPAQRLDRKLANGRPSELAPGAVHGLWVWRTGDRWHVRSTTKRVKHRFTGLISVPEGSEIGRVDPTKTDMADRIILRERAVRFDFTTQGHEDGFDFTVEGKGCVHFAVKFDGEPVAAIVKVGEDNVVPESWHFKLCG